MKEAGSTFLAIDPESHKEHLWIVLSDPEKDPEKVLIVNLTTPRPWKEQVCLVYRNEHPWLTHDSWVDYQQSRVTTLAYLYEGKDSGLFKIQDPMAPAILKRVRDASLQSTRMPLQNADGLLVQ